MIKYIDNNIEHGIKYDFNEIKKELARLKCPAGVYTKTFQTWPRGWFHIP